jgi:hypothetical protein
MADICPKCNAPPAKGCDGQGYILVTKDGTEEEPWFNPEHVRQCPNLYARQLADHLGPELAPVKHVTSSPLLELGPKGTDLTRSNLFITGCPWRNLLPHLKWALGQKRQDFHPLLFFFLILTDEQIKDVWVGNKQYRALSMEDRENVKTYNSLGDLLEGRDLVIIKLGYLWGRNRAAPGMLKEALLIREALGKATWLVYDPNRDWTVSYDPTVAEYVKANFKGLRIEPTAEPGIELPADIVVDEDDEDDGFIEEVMNEVQDDWSTLGDTEDDSGEGPSEGPMT